MENIKIEQIGAKKQQQGNKIKVEMGSFLKTPIIKKKVLFLSPWYPNRYDPMPGLFVKRHAEILTEDFKVFVIYVMAVNNLKIKYEPELSIENNILTVRVYYNINSINIPGINKLLKIWKFYNAHQIGFREIKKRIGLPDLVHVNILTRVGLYAYLLKLKFGIPYVITEHWSRYLSIPRTYHGFIRKMVTRWVVSKSNAVSTVSLNLKEAMITCGLNHHNFYLVNNVVDFDLFKPSGTVDRYCCLKRFFQTLLVLTTMQKILMYFLIWYFSFKKKFFFILILRLC